MAQKPGIIGAVTYACRHCLSKLVKKRSPDMAPEVRNLLAELHFSNRDVSHLWEIFHNCHEHDPITVATLDHEVCVSSLLLLVRNDRVWITKILFTLVELGGYVNILTWDGFLWIMLQFCTLSKIELCQVLFYIIAKETRSWSLNMLTSSQLEDFYSDWNHCPVKSFDTEHIQFDCLAQTRYTMVDFIELVTRHGSLINPLVHLQRSIQQSVPSLRFWSDYDRVKVNNRYIPLDFFRYRKSQSIAEMLHEADMKNMDKEMEAATTKMGADNLRVLQESAGLIADGDQGHHVPLPGSRKPPTRLLFQTREDPAPAWMQAMNMDNKDPILGTALGSAVPPTPREMKPQPQVAKLIVKISRCTGLPLPVHAYCTCEIEGRPATRCRSKTIFGTDPAWDEQHEIYGYIVDDTKRLEFNIWEATLLVKVHLPQAKFYPHGWEGKLTYPGGFLEIKIEVTLPKTVSDAKDMVLSTFGEEARGAAKNAEIARLVQKLKDMQEKKLSFSRIQQLDFIAASRVKEPVRKNMVYILGQCRPEELIDRPEVITIGHGHH